MLRNLIPHARIGFFLHVPFPTAELYRILPNREQLLQGILSSDLIGFQTYQYARHFFSACECVLGVECSSKGVDYGGHFASVCITSVGINPDRFEALAKSASVRAVMDRWNQKLKGRRMLLGIDKLESTMGLIHKLLAIEDLFADNPQLPRQVAFVQVRLLQTVIRRVTIWRGGACTSEATLKRTASARVATPFYGNPHKLAAECIGC
jgi:trehalose-6-phosphate synthase